MDCGVGGIKVIDEYRRVGGEIVTELGVGKLSQKSFVRAWCKSAVRAAI